MADSPAVRARRYRQHRSGDHTDCRHDRPRLVLAAGAAEPDPDFDPAAELRALAARLAGAYQADPANAAVARELRLTLLAIAPEAEPEWDPIKELQLDERNSRRSERDSPS